MCNFSPHFHAVQHYFCVGFTFNMPHTKGTVLLVCFQWVDALASKHAKGMSLRYDAICALGIGDAALCEAPCKRKSQSD